MSAYRHHQSGRRGKGQVTKARRVGAAALMKKRFWQRGFAIAAFYYYPHHNDGMAPEYAIACNYRKPKPGNGGAGGRGLWY